MSLDLESIQEMWKKDSDIDRDNLHEESLKIPSLHAKYFVAGHISYIVDSILESDICCKVLYILTSRIKVQRGQFNRKHILKRYFEVWILFAS